MNVSFASSDPFNSSVVDSATGQFLFMVETPTPPGKGRRTTTIFNAQRQIVGVFDRNLGHDSVSVRGTMMRVGEWLPKKSWRSRSVTRQIIPSLRAHLTAVHVASCSSRLFVAPDSRAYMWKHGLAGYSQVGPPHLTPRSRHGCSPLSMSSDSSLRRERKGQQLKGVFTPRPNN